MSMAKAQVAVRDSLNIKGIGRGKVSVIPVRRNDPGADARLGRNRLPSQRYLFRRHPRHPPDRWEKAQRFFDGAIDRCGILMQAFYDLRMQKKAEHGIA